MRKIVLLLIFITTAIASWADEKITFTASAPEVVVSGDQFRLTFSINSQKIKDFRAPNIKGLEVLMGPSRSTQSSTQIINGNVTSTKSTTFTYILMAEKEGTYSIPGATIVADGNNYTSNSVSVKVLPPDQSTGTASNNGRTSRNQANNGKISEKELIVIKMIYTLIKKLCRIFFTANICYLKSSSFFIYISTCKVINFFFYIS